MRPSLAEQMYVAFRSNSPDPASLPAWGNLDTDSRTAWAASADRAEKVVIEQCANKLDEAAMMARATSLVARLRALRQGRHVKDDPEGATEGIAWAAQHLRGHV